MGKLSDRLNAQLKTEYAKDAEECLKIYNSLKKNNDGKVWNSQWTPLVDTIFKGFPSSERRYVLTSVGRVYLKGLEEDTVSLLEVRQAFSDYYASEGCTCCEDTEAHSKAEQKLAELLQPDRHDDGRGFDWYKYQTDRNIPQKTYKIYDDCQPL